MYSNDLLIDVYEWEWRHSISLSLKVNVPYFFVYQDSSLSFSKIVLYRL